MGCDRTGDALGSAVVQLAIWMNVSFMTSGLLGTALALAGVGAWAALRLDGAYSSLLRQRLVDRAVELDLADIEDSTTRSVVVSAPPAHDDAPRTMPSVSPLTAGYAPDTTLETVRELRSGNDRRILEALKDPKPPSPVVAAQLIRLLAWDQVSGAVREALLRDTRQITGLLIDHLTNEEVQFGIRRRIPRILAHSGVQLAVYGLLAGLQDSRFEVRFQCSRALDFLVQRKPDLSVSAEVVFAAVERELRVARPIWESRRLLDRRDSSDPQAFLDEILRERANQSLEHVFSLFATVLPRDAVMIAFRALHTDDRVMRGLAAEYLDGVLPAAVRERLWAMVESGPPIQSLRPPQEALADLLQSHQSLLLRIGGTTPQP